MKMPCKTSGAMMLLLAISAAAQDFVVQETLTKPVKGANGEIVEYAITFVLRDARQRPVGNTPYQISLGTGQVICGYTRSNGMAERVSSGVVQTTANISVSSNVCVPRFADDKGTLNPSDGVGVPSAAVPRDTVDSDAQIAPGQ